MLGSVRTAPFGCQPRSPQSSVTRFLKRVRALTPSRSSRRVLYSGTNPFVAERVIYG